MDLATKQTFFLFFAIHLPPVEEGEFLLYIMLNFNASLLTDAEPTKPQPIITAFFNNHFLLCNNLLLFNSSLHVFRNNFVDGYILDISQVPLFLPQHVHSYGIPIP